MFPTLLLLTLCAQNARDLTAEDLRGLAWRSVGPANMGGRVSAIALVPGSRKAFYVGFATGGVWKTENLGVTFAPIFDRTGVHSIGSLGVAGPEGKIVWVGTGEGNGRNSSSWGNGVWRSTDGGETFTHLGLAATHDIPSLAVDPRNPDVCYIAALGRLWGPNPERGVYKTGDGGKTWAPVLKGDENLGACDVLLDPRSPDTVWAALYARRRTAWSFTGNSEAGGLFRSDDAGKTWKKLIQGLPPRTGRIGLTVFAKDPRILYAVVESDVGGTGRDPFANRSPSGGLFRSDDRGDTWRRMNDWNFRPFYFSRVAVDPENDRRVYVPGWDLAISDDAGKTLRRSGSEHVHVDFHAIVINPVDTSQILVGNDGGVYVSHDRAETWDYLNRIAAGQFYRVAVDDSDPYRIGGGLQDNGSWVGPSETLTITDDEEKSGILNCDWRMIYFGDGFTVAFDPTDPDLVYATSQGGDIARLRLSDHVKKLIKPVPREGQPRFRFNWNPPFLISAHDPSVLYLGGQHVFKLTGRGDHWASISPDLSRNEADKVNTVGSDAETYGTIVTLSESARARGLLWAGTDDGRVHVTRDDGKAWRDVTPPEVDGLYVARVVASRHAPETAYVVVDGHRSDRFEPLVLMTEDLGATWTNVTGDLPPGTPAKSLIEDLGSGQVLWCGTESGAYVTVDRGKRWVRLNGKSLPPAPVDDLVQQPRERDLVVGTHGRSIWVLDDASMFAQLTPETRARPLHLFDLLPAKPRFLHKRLYGIGHGVFRAKNGPMGATINYWLREDTGEDVKIAIADAGDVKLCELKGPGRAGLNRVVWDLQAEEKHRFDEADEKGLGQTEFVPAGEYRVTLRRDQEKMEKKLRVLPAPGKE